METNELKLLSISAAAKILCLGKDAVYKLVADGKIGFIEIGKRKKITYHELVRFQKDNIKRLPEKTGDRLMTKNEINKFFNLNHSRKNSLNGQEILKSIMR
jgi:excisionase family DNA binding protein